MNSAASDTVPTAVLFLTDDGTTNEVLARLNRVPRVSEKKDTSPAKNGSNETTQARWINAARAAFCLSHILTALELALKCQSITFGCGEIMEFITSSTWTELLSVAMPTTCDG